MKYIIICICLFMSTVIVAQSTMVNKTTISVDKSVDGKIVKEVFELEGEEVEKKLKELENDPSVVSVNVEKRVEMSSDNPNDLEIQKMKEEMDVEISNIEKVTGKKAERREENVEIQVTENDNDALKKYSMKITENGKEEVLEWNGEGEMPEKMKELMQQTEVILMDEGMEAPVSPSKEDSTSGQIGVMASDVKGGVEILSFKANSMASVAGLKIGDIITAVNGKSIITMDDLVSGMSLYKPGDIVSVSFTRGDNKLTKEVKLN